MKVAVSSVKKLSGNRVMIQVAESHRSVKILSMTIEEKSYSVRKKLSRGRYILKCDSES